MAQMYCKVFINKVSLVFSDSEKSGCKKAPETVSQTEFGHWVNSLYHLADAACFEVRNDPGAKWRLFQAQHTVIKAAGGMVIDQAGKLLVIKRLGMWDLPKGKIESGENPEQAALREVEEECGIDHLDIISQLPDTFHCYRLDEQKMLKQTYWYEMRYRDSLPPSPQFEEDITEVRFMDADEVEHAMKQTYPSLLPLFNTYCSRYK
jgi:8-oxo-dGTP pyrophosphatase MutT (NUDIX family)